MLRLKFRIITEIIPLVAKQKLKDTFMTVEELTYLDKVKITQAKVTEAKV